MIYTIVPAAPGSALTSPPGKGLSRPVIAWAVTWNVVTEDASVWPVTPDGLVTEPYRLTTPPSAT